MNPSDQSIYWIKGGRVIDPYQDIDEQRDVFIEGSRLINNPDESFLRESTQVNVQGAVVSPGLTELQAHLREPGETHKETIASGTRAAARGGFTRLVCMPNTRPPCDNPGNLRLIHDAIERGACIDVFSTGCMTIGAQGEQLAPIGSLKNAGAVALSEGGKCIQNNEIMRRVLEYAKMMDLVILDHCQDYSMTADSVMNESIVSLKLGLRGWPNEAEDLMVARDVILCEKTQAKVHLQNLSSGISVDIIERAKNRNIPITAEVTPHHLCLTDESVQGYDTRYKMNPPLRTEEDRQRLIEGLKNGLIDCIACDHAPHSEDDKDMEFSYAPFGIIGLETSLAVTLTELYHKQGFSLLQILKWMASVPDSILGFEPKAIKAGNYADLMIFEPDTTWVPEKDGFLSMSSNSPWIGKELKGKVKQTFYRGKVVYE